VAKVQHDKRQEEFKVHTTSLKRKSDDDQTIKTTKLKAATKTVTRTATRTNSSVARAPAKSIPSRAAPKAKPPMARAAAIASRPIAAPKSKAAAKAAEPDNEVAATKKKRPAWDVKVCKTDLGSIAGPRRGVHP
jgi:hypothetical protein